MATAARPAGTRAKPAMTAGEVPTGKIPPNAVPGAGTPMGADPGTATGGIGTATAATATVPAAAPAACAAWGDINISRTEASVVVVFVYASVEGQSDEGDAGRFTLWCKSGSLK